MRALWAWVLAAWAWINTREPEYVTAVDGSRDRHLSGKARVQARRAARRAS